MKSRSKEDDGDDDVSGIKPATKFTFNMKNEGSSKSQPDSDDEKDSKDVKFEGYLYKQTQTKLKKLFFRLINQRPLLYLSIN